MASIASQSEGSTRLYKLIGADVSLLLPSLIITPTGWWIKQYGLDYIYYIVFGSRNVFIKNFIKIFNRRRTPLYYE